MNLSTERIKRALGQYYTVKDSWLTKPVFGFIKSILPEVSAVLDPFAGEGHLLETLKRHFNLSTYGLDIAGGRWEKNDSLVRIPKIPGTFICTNPPYLYQSIAVEKGLFEINKHYFKETDNLYKTALLRCFEASRYSIVIIPKSFLLSSFPKHYLKLASILEDNLFSDTKYPVLVACFDTSSFFFDGYNDADIYIGDKYCYKMSKFEEYKNKYLNPNRNNRFRIIFNCADGQIGLKGLNTNTQVIRFMRAEDLELSYPIEKIKERTRENTLIKIPEVKDRDKLINLANKKLAEIRRETKDLILSPFKINTQRLITYKTTRYILEECLKQLQSEGDL